MKSMNSALTKNYKQSWSLSANQLIILTCIYMAAVLNFPFLSKAYTAITISDEYSVLFLLSVPLLLCCLFIMINAVLAVGQLLKPILIVSVLLSALLFYATLNYGIVFDYSMVQNAFHTDTAEAFSYLNFNVLGSLLLFALVPVILILKINIKPQSMLNMIAMRLSLLGAAIAVVAIITFSFSANYAAVGRNNHELIGYITPYKFINSTIKYTNKNYFMPPLEYKVIDASPYIINSRSAQNVTILVLGETARAQSFSLNGYSANTNPYTHAAGVISFQDVSSCGTATAVSVPCMFSRLDRSNYDNRIASSQQNVIDIASLAGTDVLWVDNNNGSCKGVCNRVETIAIEPDPSQPFCDSEYCLDEALLGPLQTKLDNLTHQNTLIILHMMGSHGPTYFRRYPKDKRMFEPDCQRSDIQHCSKQELVNSYDNTIAYTDFVLGKMIDALSALSVQKNVQSSLVYVSDHGESLGENGLYLHGMPYAFAPKEQTHIPMLYWQTANNQLVDTECLFVNRATTISHDNWFDLVLGLTAVQTHAYNVNNDPIAPCRRSKEQLALIQQETDTMVD